MGLIALWIAIYFLSWLGGSAAVMAFMGNLHHAGLEMVPAVSYGTALGIMFPLFFWAMIRKAIDLLVEDS